MPQSDRDKAIQASIRERGFRGAFSHGPTRTENFHKRSRLSLFQRKTREEQDEEDRIKKANQATLDKRKKIELQSIQNEEKEIKQRIEIIKDIRSGKSTLEDLENLKAPIGTSDVLPKRQQEENKRRQNDLNKKIVDVVKEKINTNRKKVDVLNDTISNPNKAITKDEAEKQFNSLVSERKTLDAELAKISQVTNVVGFGTATQSDKGSVERISDAQTRKNLQQKIRDFERFRNPSKIFPSGSETKRLKFNPNTGLTELSSELTPTEFKKQQEIKKEGTEPEVSAEEKEEKEKEEKKEGKAEFDFRLLPSLVRET